VPRYDWTTARQRGPIKSFPQPSRRKTQSAARGRNEYNIVRDADMTLLSSFDWVAKSGGGICSWRGFACGLVNRVAKAPRSMAISSKPSTRVQR